MSTGIHEKAVGATVEWYTPPSLFEALGVTFNLDPACSHGGYCAVPAGRHYTPEDQGLWRPWEGHVWLNPPYGRELVPFVDRMIAHGDGLLLVASRTETAAYQRALAAASLVCLLRERLAFIRDDGYTFRSSFGSTIFAFGEWASKVLADANLGWVA